MRRVMRFVISLYPREWRQRYGAELEALVNDVQPSWRVLCDLARAALLMRMASFASGNAATVSIGAAIFALAQVLLYQTMEPVPGIEDSWWFLNSGHGVAVVAGLAAAGAAAFGLLHGELARVMLLTLGEAVAMAVTLFAIGPGTIVPIVLVVGSAVLATATLAGGAVGIAAHHAIIRFRSRPS